MTSLKLGDDLELDARAYELRRAGRPVRLERIPMEILLLLVDHRQDLVTREQIVERVWGQGVFVDTDNSINGAIRKIRQALRDDPENPRFISTVTGKGYRFIAPVLGGDEAPPVANDPLSVAAPVPEIPPPIAEPAQRASRRWLVPLAALALVGAVGAYLQWSRSSSASRPSDGRLMLAVLPFDNLTGDPGQDYFSDGFTEEMITRLGSLAPQRLGVIARTSVMYYKAARAPLDKMGRELGVQYVLEGSIRRDSDRVRITAQLIDVKDQTHLWARQYDREQTDVLHVQEEIAQAIADQIELTLDESRSPSVRATNLSPQDFEAYVLYLRGRYFWNKRTQDGFQRAVESFQEAIAKNPHDARAFAGLADAYALIGTYGYAPQDEVVPKAREAAMKALEIDANLAAAHTSLALISEHYDWDWPAAGDRFRRAIELDLNYATAHHWYAEYLAFQGRFDEALEAIEKARQLDPLSLIIATDKGVILYLARKHDRAIEQFRAVLAVDPMFEHAHMIVAALSQQGRFADALADIHEWQERNHGPWPHAWAAHVYGRLGKPAEARLALQEMEESNRHSKVASHWLRATAYLGMGLKEESLACLEQACKEHSSVLVSLKVEPIFDPLRDDPRFQDLLRCVRLAP
ncbi:MAG TPA: winged helix-turn-helix domain-containing protein [Candidatus Polarisedimenticolia bacterium]|nr:winged helix-turn-helix domain-containing protein [Candidatus Polarisedimenticolia bacterium]